MMRDMATVRMALDEYHYTYRHHHFSNMGRMSTSLEKHLLL